MGTSAFLDIESSFAFAHHLFRCYGSIEPVRHQR
jgi:hypothetical protein